MIKVQNFENQLMSSVCYIVYDDVTSRCVIIDPGSEKSLQEIDFVDRNLLSLDYIILTHEHTDHNWGVNALLDRYPSAKLICSELCDKLVKKTNRIFFSFYYDNPDYIYTIAPANILVKSEDDLLSWDGLEVHFLMTPGHSKASMCIDIDGMLFTGDTIMPFPRYLNKKDGNIEDWKKSIAMVESKYIDETVIYPGHGDVLTLGEWKKNFSNDDR